MNNPLTSVLNWLDTTQWTNLSALAAVLGVFVNSGVLITTIIYVTITGKMLRTASRHQVKNANFQNEKIRNDTLIDLTRTWGSKEFITARNNTFHLLKKNDMIAEDVYEKFNEMAGKKEFEENPWINVSLIGQFIARIGRLAKTEQIDREDAKFEFESAISFWAPIIVPIYDNMADGKTVSRSIHDAFGILCTEKELPRYPYARKIEKDQLVKNLQPTAKI